MRNIVCLSVILLSLFVAIVISNYVSILFFVIALIAALSLKTENHRSIKYKGE